MALSVRQGELIRGDLLHRTSEYVYCMCVRACVRACVRVLYVCVCGGVYARVRMCVRVEHAA